MFIPGLTAWGRHGSRHGMRVWGLLVAGALLLAVAILSGVRSAGDAMSPDEMFFLIVASLGTTWGILLIKIPGGPHAFERAVRIDVFLIVAITFAVIGLNYFGVFDLLV